MGLLISAVQTISSELNKAFQNKKKSINDVIVTSSLPFNVDTTRPHSHFPLMIKMLSPKGNTDIANSPAKRKLFDLHVMHYDHGNSKTL